MHSVSVPSTRYTHLPILACLPPSVPHLPTCRDDQQSTSTRPSSRGVNCSSSLMGVMASRRTTIMSFSSSSVTPAVWMTIYGRTHLCTFAVRTCIQMDDMWRARLIRTCANSTVRACMCDTAHCILVAVPCSVCTGDDGRLSARPKRPVVRSLLHCLEWPSYACECKCPNATHLAHAYQQAVVVY